MMLAESFKNISEAQENRKADLVNYVWINQSKVDHAPDGPLCAVSLTDIDKALENARRYPQADFIIWLDYALLDDLSRFFIESRLYLAGLVNVSLKNLRDIASYRDNPLFSSDLDHEKSIRQRVDLARLFVLGEYAWREYKNVFYADFDVPDIRLGDPACESRLEEYGMVFGLDPDGLVENSFMGFRCGAEAVELLAYGLIPHTEEALRQRNEVNGYYALSRVLIGWCQQRGASVVAFMPEIGVPIVERTGFAAPADPFYKECGIN